jgi:hypothetical protein
MNCKYCQLECDTPEPSSSFIKKCKKCDVTYYYGENNEIQCCIIKYQDYACEFWPRNVWVDKFFLTKNHIVILQLSYLPDITPLNIKNKLKTLLVFQ